MNGDKGEDAPNISQIFDSLPRRDPAERLLFGFERTLTNRRPLRFPAGERAEVLNERGMAAFHEITFSAGAANLIAEQGSDKTKALAKLLNQTSAAVFHEISRMPRKMELVVDAVRRADPDVARAEAAEYERYRANYLGHLGTLAKKHPDSFGEHFASAVIRKRDDLPSALTYRPDIRDVITMTREGMTCLREGRSPPGLGIDHRKQLGLEYKDAPGSSNMVGNLFLTPEWINKYSQRVHDMQYPVVFPRNGDPQAFQLMLMVQTKNGPEQGHFIYGASQAVKIEPNALDALLDTHIGALPENTKARHAYAAAPAPLPEARRYSSIFRT